MRHVDVVVDQEQGLVGLLFGDALGRLDREDPSGDSVQHWQGRLIRGTLHKLGGEPTFIPHLALHATEPFLGWRAILVVQKVSRAD